MPRLAHSADNSTTRRTPNLPLNPTHFRIRRLVQIEHDHAVLALPLHRRREIQRPLRPDVPVTSQVMAVGPGEAFAEGLYVQEGVGGRADLDGAAMEGGAVELGAGPALLVCSRRPSAWGRSASLSANDMGAGANMLLNQIVSSPPFVVNPVLLLGAA